MQIHIKQTGHEFGMNSHAQLHCVTAKLIIKYDHRQIWKHSENTVYKV